MSEKKSAKIFYADLWGLRSEKYKYLLENDVKTTKWQELKPTTPYYFFVPKDFALQSEYDKFWKVTEIFSEWSSGVKTRRDQFMVAFYKEDLVQHLRIFAGNLPDEMIHNSLKIHDTKYWSIKKARGEVRKVDFEDKIMPYAYRPFDSRFVFYFPNIIERGDAREPLMKHLLKENFAIAFKRSRYIKTTEFHHSFVINSLGDINFFGDQSIVFPLYLYPGESKEKLLDDKAHKPARIPNFTPEFLQAIKESLGSEPSPEEIFYYIYAVLYSPIYRKRYEEFLKIDFPQVPLPSNNEAFKELNSFGKELVDLHLLEHSSLADTEVGFPKGGSNMMEKVVYDEQNQIVFINKEQYFEGISKEVWKYRIGAYQVMEKYLKDRKSRKLSLDEIDHYMKMAKAIRLTIVLQEKIDEVYRKIEI